MIDKILVNVVVLSIGERKPKNTRKAEDKVFQTLLVKNPATHPHWALPGGIVGPNKVQDYAEQTLYALTNAKDAYENASSKPYISQVTVFEEIEEAEEKTRVLRMVYMALVDRDLAQILETEDDAKAAWFEIRLNESPGQVNMALIGGGDLEGTELSASVPTQEARYNKAYYEMQFQTGEANGMAPVYAKAIASAFMDLRGKVSNIEKSRIISAVMPYGFTVSQLQQVYETLLNRRFTAADFRRRMLPNDKKEGGKPAMLTNKGKQEKTPEGKYQQRFRPADLFLYTEQKTEGAPPKLIFKKDGVPQIFELNENRFRVGRAKNDVEHVCDHPRISRNHMCIIWRDGRVYVIDDSKNGTFVNGTQIAEDTEHELTDGDVITPANLDEFSFTLEWDFAPEPLAKKQGNE